MDCQECITFHGRSASAPGLRLDDETVVGRLDIQVRGESLELSAEIRVRRESVGEVSQPGVLGPDTVRQLDSLIKRKMRVMRLITDCIQSYMLQALQLL